MKHLPKLFGSLVDYVGIDLSVVDVEMSRKVAATIRRDWFAGRCELLKKKK